MEYNLGSVVTNATARKILYGLYVIAGLIIGGASVAYPLIGAGVTPDWVTAGLAVLGYLAIPFGALALANVGTPVSVGYDSEEIFVAEEEVI